MNDIELEGCLSSTREAIDSLARQMQALDTRLQNVEKIDKLVLIEIRGLLTKMDRLLAPGRLKRSI